MTKSDMICLLLPYVLIITWKIADTKEETLSQLTSNKNSLQNETFTRFNLTQSHELNTTQHSNYEASSAPNKIYTLSTGPVSNKYNASDLRWDKNNNITNYLKIQLQEINLLHKDIPPILSNKRRVAGNKIETILFNQSTKYTSDANPLKSNIFIQINELNTTAQQLNGKTSGEPNQNLTLSAEPNVNKYYDTNLKRNTINNTILLELQRRNIPPLYKIIPPQSSGNRRKQNQPQSQSVLQPEGYVYDINHCQYIDDRVLCGYDKNPDEPKKKDIIDLDDLCRKHGDRIECGYVTGPYPDAYNPDPEKDRIAKISLSNYMNIARSGGVVDFNDTNDYGAALRMGTPNSLQIEIARLSNAISKLVAALPSNTNVTSGADSKKVSVTTPYTTRTSSVSVTSSTTEAAKKESKLLSLSDIQNFGNEISKLSLSNLMFTTEFTTPMQFENKRQEKKCVEKNGRIFCRTVLV